MTKSIRLYKQVEYSRVLDEHEAREKKLTQTDCTNILMDRGLDYDQAKNAAYVYLHHPERPIARKKGDKDEYRRILTHFGADKKTPKECGEYLKSFGYRYGQAKTAVYEYRVSKGLIRK